MSIARRRLLVVVTLGILSIAAFPPPLVAQTAEDHDWTGPAHVRPTADLRALVSEAARRSPEIRARLVQLETLDVTVYVRTRALAEIGLDGHVALLAVTGRHRYLVIELACGRSALSQMATLAHELFHAAEIAAEPSVTDARSLAALYERIGRETGNWAGRRTFETTAAAEAGQRARRELLSNSGRSTNGS